MDVTSTSTVSPSLDRTSEDAGLEALMLDLDLLTALVFGPVHHRIERDQAA